MGFPQSNLIYLISKFKTMNALNGFNFVLGTSDPIVREGRTFIMLTLDNGQKVACNPIFSNAEAVKIASHKAGDIVKDRKGKPILIADPKDAKKQIQQTYKSDGFSVVDSISNMKQHMRDISKATAALSVKSLFGDE